MKKNTWLEGFVFPVQCTEAGKILLFLVIESDDCHQTKHKTTAREAGEPQDHLTKMIKHFGYSTDTGAHK